MQYLWLRWLDASEHFTGNDDVVSPSDCGRTIWQDIGVDMGKDKERQYLGIHWREDIGQGGPTKILAIPHNLILERRRIGSLGRKRKMTFSDP